MQDSKDITYFYGCPTQDGFSEEITGELFSKGIFTYIIKGGAGTGKSSMMKKVADRFENVQRFICSSDPDSLDAIFLEDKGVAFVDGTSPHICEPVYPGVMQKIIDLGEFWDGEKLLSNKEKIIALTEENKRLHQMVRRYLRAVGGLFSDIYAIGENALLKPKLDSFCRRFSNRLLTKKGKDGRLLKRRITSITPDGLLTLTDVFKGLKVYYVDDPTYACADRILKKVTSLALSKGYDVIVSTSVLSFDGQYEHIIIPELSVALTAKNIDGATKINSMRFYDKAILNEKKKRIRFSKSVLKELVTQISLILRSAKDIHDELEKYYIEAMDFDRVSELVNKLISELE